MDTETIRQVATVAAVCKSTAETLIAHTQQDQRNFDEIKEDIREIKTDIKTLSINLGTLTALQQDTEKEEAASNSYKDMKYIAVLSVVLTGIIELLRAGWERLTGN